MGQRRFYEAMRDRIVGQPQIGMVLIAADNGDVVNATIGWPPPSLNVANRESFTSAIEPDRKTLALGATSVGRISGKPRFFISRKVVSESGALLGVIAVGLEADFFADFYKRVALGSDSWLALFRSDGTLLATSLPDQPLGERLDKTLPYRMIEAGQSGKAVLTKGPFPYYSGSSPSRIVVATNVANLPAYVTVVVGESAFLTPWRNRNWLIFVVATLLTALTVVAGLGILRLIERSAAAAREASQRQVLAAIVDTPLALTAVVDRTGKIVLANSSFRRLLGVSGDDDVTNALYNPALEGVEPLLSFIKGEASLAEVDVQLVKPDDQVRRLRFSLSRQTLPDSGEIIIIVGHDETLRHQAERAIAVSAKLVTLGEITTGIAHELSQPLNVIRMAAQNAQVEAVPEPQPASTDGDDPEPPMPVMSDREFRSFAVGKLNRIIAQVDRAAAIISRMRIFSRSTREGPQSFDLRDACRAAGARVAQSYRAAEIVLEEKLGEEPLAVAGHAPLIEQVLVSILANARDAVAESPDKRKVVAVSAGPQCRRPRLGAGCRQRTGRARGHPGPHLRALFHNQAGGSGRRSRSGGILRYRPRRRGHTDAEAGAAGRHVRDRSSREQSVVSVGVLFVSTGGICRAPMAAGVFRTFASRGRVESMFDVVAAGTFDGHAGEPPSLLAFEVAQRRGYDVPAAPVRPLPQEDLSRYDHLIAMDRSNLAALRWMAPSGRTDVPQLLMRHAPQAISLDIVDPYGGTTEDYERALDLIEKGCAGLMMTILSKVAPSLPGKGQEYLP